MSPYTCRIRPNNEAHVGQHSIRYKRYVGDESVMLIINKSRRVVKIGERVRLDSNVEIQVDSVYLQDWGWRYDMHIWAPHDHEICVRKDARSKT